MYMVDDAGKRGRHHGGCPCQRCVERRIINASKVAQPVMQPVVTQEISPMALDQNVLIALAPYPVELAKYIASVTAVPVTPAVGVPVPEPVPAAPITAAPVAPAPVAPAPAGVAPVAPTPAVVSKQPLVIDIPMGNPEPRAKGFTQYEDGRGLPATFKVADGFVRIGKAYIPPVELDGREGIVTMQIIIR